MSRLAFALVFLAGCPTKTDTTDTTDDTATGTVATVAVWAGETPHLTVAGAVAGDRVELSVSGADAADLGTLYCERNYASGVFEKYEAKYNFDYKGQAAELELTVEGQEAVGSYTIGTDITFEVKIETADGTEYENAGTSGSLDIELVTGTPDGMGMIPDNEGAFGGYVSATLDDGNTFQASFTANCGANDNG